MERQMHLKIAGWLGSRSCLGNSFALIILLALVFARETSAQTNAASYALTPSPVWVYTKGNDAPPSVTPGNQDEDQRVLLLDKQIHAENNEYYRRLVKALLNENGVQNGSKLSIHFDPTYQKLALHYVRIWRNGQPLNKLQADQIKIIQQEQELAWHLYNGSVSLLLFLEDIRAGDILDYAYTIQGQNPIFQGRFIESLDLGFSMPVNQLKYRLLWPEKRRLYLKKHLTTIEPVESKVDGLVEYFWNVDASQPITQEDLVPDSYNPYPWIQLSEYADWAEVTSWAEKLYSLPTTPVEEISALTDNWKKTLPGADERILTAIKFVQDEVRYLGIEIGANSHQPTPPAIVLARRFGDCKDKALLLCALLRDMGYEAYPALVNTADRENIKDWHASPYAFNHVVVQIKHAGQEWWVDATSSGQRGRLAHRYFPSYGYALIIRSDSKTLEPVRPGTNGWPLTQVTEKLIVRGKNEMADLTITTKAEGFDADILRDSLKSVRREELEKDYLNYYAQSYPKITQAKPLEFDDDQTNNVVITTESYLVEGIWEYSKEDERHFCEFYPRELAGLLDTPRTRLRTMPLGVDFPLHRRHRTEVQLPEDWPVKTNQFVLHGHALHFSSYRTYANNLLVMEYELTALTNALPPAFVAEHVKQIEQIRDQLGYSLYWGEETDTAQSNAPNWTIVFLAGLYGLILFAIIVAIYLKKRACPPPLPDPDMMERYYFLKGMGGWLLLVALGICINPFTIASAMYQMLHLYSAESWSYLTTPSSEGYDSLWAPYLLFSLLANETIIVWSVFNFVLFFQKRHYFPTNYVVFMVVLAVLVTLDYILARQIQSVSQEIGTDELRDVTRAYVVCAVWIPYFLISKRVKVTFTR